MTDTNSKAQVTNAARKLIAAMPQATDKARIAALEAQVEGMRVALENAAHLLSLMRGRPTDRHTLTYTNYRGEKSERELHLVRIWWGETEWHPEPQLLLSAFDYEKDAYRNFAVKDFDFRSALQSSETTGEKP